MFQRGGFVISGVYFVWCGVCFGGVLPSICGVSGVSDALPTICLVSGVSDAFACNLLGLWRERRFASNLWGYGVIDAFASNLLGLWRDGASPKCPLPAQGQKRSRWYVGRY